VNDGRKVALIVVIAAVVMAALLATPPLAAEEAALPDPDLPSATQAKAKHFERPPASAELVAWARGWKRHAQRDLTSLNRARACFGMPRIVPGWSAPPRSAWRAPWAKAGDRWRDRARDYHARFDALRQRMSHPGPGGVERWRPLVRWHWPAHLVERALWVMKLESGGSPTARNPSGAAGLFQLYPAPAGWANPDTNVWYAYWKKYRPAGSFSPWVVTH
jgi:hypothetical protein